MTTAPNPHPDNKSSCVIPVFLIVEQVVQRLYVGRSTAYNMVNVTYSEISISSFKLPAFQKSVSMI